MNGQKPKKYDGTSFFIIAVASSFITVVNFQGNIHMFQIQIFDKKKSQIKTLCYIFTCKKILVLTLNFKYTDFCIRDWDLGGAKKCVYAAKIPHYIAKGKYIRLH